MARLRRECRFDHGDSADRPVMERNTCDCTDIHTLASATINDREGNLKRSRLTSHHPPRDGTSRLSRQSYRDDTRSEAIDCERGASHQHAAQRAFSSQESSGLTFTLPFAVVSPVQGRQQVQSRSLLDPTGALLLQPILCVDPVPPSERPNDRQLLSHLPPCSQARAGDSHRMPYSLHLTIGILHLLPQRLVLTYVRIPLACHVRHLRPGFAQVAFRIIQGRLERVH